ncbi:hypothetical protein FNF28_01947 [Cafeteria roenbergensis]|uniref:Uncharacterized protein n=1 Tax=Cafeteria roenbergensis TaxID=33653 RepID=A0A5A8E0R6_CAFRO|nr:hypothetical protein FNF28_01947 [Cafeteria roenbergensis]
MAELASVREDFDAAVAFVAKPPASVVRHVDNEEKLIFYGLFKQATVGDNSSPQPSVFLSSFADRYKWAAWDSRRGMSKTDAQRAYLAELSKRQPDWQSLAGRTATPAGDASLSALVGGSPSRSGRAGPGGGRGSGAGRTADGDLDGGADDGASEALVSLCGQLEGAVVECQGSLRGQLGRVRRRLRTLEERLGLDLEQEEDADDAAEDEETAAAEEEESRLGALSGTGLDAGSEDVDEAMASRGRNPKTLRKALSRAVARGDLTEARKALEAGAATSAANNDGQTLIMLAANSGNAKMVRLLAEHGADLEAKDKEGQTALCIAARKGHMAAATELLDFGANLETVGLFDSTALIWAARDGQAKMARLLVDRGANIEADMNTYTALTWAAREGQYEIAKMLLDHGARVNGPVGAERTPLIRSAEAGHFRVGLLLLYHGADLEARDGKGRTALCWAVMERDARLTALLLDSGADTETKTFEGESLISMSSPLELASARGAHAQQSPLCVALEGAGASRVSVASSVDSSRSGQASLPFPPLDDDSAWREAALAETAPSPRVLTPRALKRRLARAQNALRDTEAEEGLERWLARHGAPVTTRFDREQLRQLRRWFDFMDADGSGQIDVSELEEPLVSTGVAQAVVAQTSAPASKQALPPGRARAALEPDRVEELHARLEAAAETTMHLPTQLTAHRRQLLISALVTSRRVDTIVSNATRQLLARAADLSSRRITQRVRSLRQRYEASAERRAERLESLADVVPPETLSRVREYLGQFKGSQAASRRSSAASLGQRARSGSGAGAGQVHASASQRRKAGRRATTPERSATRPAHMGRDTRTVAAKLNADALGGHVGSPGMSFLPLSSNVQAARAMATRVVALAGED